MGGTCLNRGCVPTKFLIHATGILWQARHARAYGLEFGDISVNLGQMMKQKGAVVDRLKSGVEYLMNKNKIESVRGTGSIMGRGRVSVIGDQQKIIDADKIIIATGSEPSSIPVTGRRTGSNHERRSALARPVSRQHDHNRGRRIGVSWRKYSTA